MSIKLNRALKWAKLLPTAEREIVKQLSPAIVKANTSKSLLLIIKALNQHWHNARAFEVRTIVDEGCFYHTGQKKLYEFD